MKKILTIITIALAFTLFTTKALANENDNDNLNIKYYDLEMELLADYNYNSNQFHFETRNHEVYDIYNTEVIYIQHKYDTTIIPNNYVVELNYTVTDNSRLYVFGKNQDVALTVSDVVQYIFTKNSDDNWNGELKINTEVIATGNLSLYITPVESINILTGSAVIENFVFYNTFDYVNDVIDYNVRFKFSELVHDIDNDYIFQINEDYGMQYYDEETKKWETATGSLVIKSVTNNSINYYDVYINNILIERVGINSMQRYHFRSNAKAILTIRNDRYNFKKGDLILNNIIKERAKNLPTYYQYVYYYDELYTDKVEASDLITEDIKIYERKEYTDNDIFSLSFNTDGGNDIETLNWKRSEVEKEIQYEHKLGDFIDELPIPIKDGHYFIRWEIVGDENYKLGILNRVATEEEITLKAIYIELGTDINIHLTGFGNIKALSGETIDTDLLPDNAIMHLAGKRFIGWNYSSLDKDTILDLNTEVFYTNGILYPVYTPLTSLNFYFVSNGGTIVAPKSISKGLGNRLEIRNQLPASKRSDYIFGGWFIDEELTVPVKEEINLSLAADFIYYDITVYAKWIENSYIAYFHTNAPELQLSPVIITKGLPVNISHAPRRIGYIFGGWFIDEAFTIKYESEPIFDNQINLYAKWTTDEDNPIPPGSNDIEPEATDYKIPIIIGVVIVLIAIAIVPKKRGR